MERDERLLALIHDEDQEINRRATLLAEGFMELAREGKNPGAKHGADFLYYQKISRTDPVDRNLCEDVALQKQLETFRSMRQGVGWPGMTDGAVKKPSADKFDVVPPAPEWTRRPASPRWSDYPTTMPTVPGVE